MKSEVVLNCFNFKSIYLNYFKFKSLFNNKCSSMGRFVKFSFFRWLITSFRISYGSIFTSHSNSCEKDSKKGCITSAMVIGFPSSWDNVVTPLSSIPQGTMWENHVRSLLMFIAIPCVVMYRLPCTPGEIQLKNF